GLELFEKLFGYKSKSFIAPTYTWHPDLELVLNENGVTIIQSNPFQKFPILNRTKYKKKIHYTGQKNKYNQTYIVRNAYFEPTLLGSNSVVENCLSRIDIALKCRKPAVLGSHRLNFIGFIDSKNRDKNLILLKTLLKEIGKIWPNVEFMNVAQLNDILFSN